jgi:hypothetical protein
MLPIVSQPTYTVDVPKIGTVKYRPFINNEHKSLLTVIDLGDDGSVFNTMCEIIKACTFNIVEPLELAPYQIEFLYMNIYTKSVDNRVSGSYTCPNMVSTIEGEEPTKCGSQFNVSIPLESTTVRFPDKFEERSTVTIDDTTNIVFRVVPAHIQQEIELKLKHADLTKEQSEEINNRFVFSAIDCVNSTSGKLEPIKNFSFDEFVVWYGSLSVSTVSSISKFFAEQPYIGLDHTINCPICGHKEEHKFVGLASFFT